MAVLPPHFAQMIGLIRAEDLAEEWGYAGANSAFRNFCAKLGLRHVPGRPGWFDPKHVRQRLDAAQGMEILVPPRGADGAASLVAQRRARNASI
ncbi:hypothetical protein [Paracoccus aminovorans]|uniref:hypothetical protein n=1 Tax=Paracoccus aminovorans TaxID=34004 RepID=UPI002B26163D|nr:hypothetical protein [Paracoccus aminovorans]